MRGLFMFSAILCVVASAQNVGIGTNTPIAKLHIEVQPGFGSPIVQVNQTGSGTPYFIIQSNGNVGIGVASPSEALDVSGNIRFTGSLMPAGNAGAPGQVLISQGPGTPPQWQNITIPPAGDSVCSSVVTNFVQKWTGTELCNSIIYDDGTNVGIGTTTPSEKLHVIGDVRIISNSDVNTTAGSGSLYILNSGGTTGLHLDQDEIQTINTDLYINNDNVSSTHINNLAHILTSGQIGVGTTTPHASSILHISSTNKGVLVPRMTTSQRNAITSPANGLLIYNTDCDVFEYYSSLAGGWISFDTRGGTQLQALTPDVVSSTYFIAKWTPVTGATSYTLTVATDPYMTSPIPGYNNLNVGNVTSYKVTGLRCGTTYYFQVKANLGGCGGNLASNVQAVTTKAPDYCGGLPPMAWDSILPNPPSTIPTRENFVITQVNGKIYMGLGQRGNSEYKDWWEWDPCTNTWTQKASYPTANGRNYPFLFVLNGEIYVGGGERNGTVYNNVYKYNPNTNTWTAVASLPVPLYYAAATSDGTYGYVFGGIDNSGTYNATIYKYDPSTNTWFTLATYPGGPRRSPFIAYYNGKLYMGTGDGPNSGDCSNDFYSYDLSTNTWTALPNYPTKLYEGWAVTDSVAGIIYIVGGQPNCSNITDQYYYFDVSANAWKPMPRGPHATNNLNMAQWNGILIGGFGKTQSIPISYLRDWHVFCPMY